MNRQRRHLWIFGKFLLMMVLGTILFVGTAAAQTAAPVATQLFPSSARAGSPAFTLTVLGSGFAPGAIVQWDGSSRITAFVNNGDLEASITASDLVNPGTVSITVINPGSPASNALTFTIITTHPNPIITGLSPSSAVAGGHAFNLTVYGDNFSEQSVVRWNGEDRETYILDEATLQALITEEDIASVGTAQVTVFEDAPGGGASDPRAFAIREFSNFYFPQVAAGGGYTTVFTLMNTGAETDLGSLTLTDTSGNPLVVSGAAGSSAPTSASQFPLVVPAGGITIITATAPSGSSTTKTGWARVDSTKGLLSGVASFQTTQGNLVTSIAGVLAAQPIGSGTIPVDNDATRGRRAGFAVANPNSFDIRVQIIVLDENGHQVGNTLVPPELNPLSAGRQVAKFLDEYLPQLATFKGTMILLPEGSGSEFVAVALSISQGLTSLGSMSVIPVVPGYTPAIR